MLDGINFKTIVYSVLGGMFPTILWLRFWIQEDSKHKKPAFISVLTFIAGMLVVLVALPIENWVANLTDNLFHVIIAGSIIEEGLKMAIVVAITFSPALIKDPLDYPIYLITGALGFAALENTIFLLEPITHQPLTVSFLTGNLRFLGATILHAVASASIGIALGLSFYQSKKLKVFHALIGLMAAIVLHALFNYFIMKNTLTHTVAIFGIIWVAGVILLLLFEKLKHLKHNTSITRSNYYN